MLMKPAYILPKLKNQQDFEALCVDVLNIKYKDRGYEFELYGKNGEKQQGIDIKSMHRTRDGKYITAQCKNYTGDNDDKNLREFRRKVRDDADTVTCLTFDENPAEVDTFLVMTALNRTVRLQGFIADLDEDHEEKFKTEAMFWEDIADIVIGSPYLMEKYFPFLIKPGPESTLAELNGDASHYRAAWVHKLFLENDDGNAKRLCDMHQLPNYQLPDFEKQDDRAKRDIGNACADTEELEYSAERSDIEVLLSRYIKEKQLCLIFGLPGIGKSTLFTWMLNQNKIGEVPIDAKKIFLFRFACLEDILKEKKDAAGMAAALADYFTEKTGNPEDKIILLDGFDEISCVNQVRAELLRKLSQKLNGRCTCLITCRQNYISNMNGLRDIPWLRLRPFTGEQIDRYITGYQVPHLSKKLRELLCAEENRDVFGLPVVLYMTLAVFSEREDVEFHWDITRYDIYDRIFSLKNGIYDRMRKIDSSTNISTDWGAEQKTGSKNIPAEKLDRVSADLAVWMFSHGREVCPRVEAQRILEKNGLAGVEGLGDGFFELNYLETAGREYKWKEVRFVHRSIYEYFAARTIAREINSLAEYDSLEDLDRRIVGTRKKLGNILMTESLQSAREVYEYLQSNIRRDSLNPLTRCFEEMLIYGMIDAEQQVDIYYTDEISHPMIMWERYEKEQNCFWNMLTLLQIARRGKGEIPFADLRSMSHPNDRAAAIAGLEFYLRMRRKGICIEQEKSQLLNHMNLRGCCFDDMNLAGYDLSGSDVTGCTFRHAELAGTNLAVTPEDLRSDRFAGADFLMRNARTEQVFQRANMLVYPGNLIGFGRDPKTQQPVLWRVLDIRDGAALILSERALRQKDYHDKMGFVTWEKSSLCGWLNGKFYESWFSEEEKARITSGEGKASRIFLLSLSEVCRYFGAAGYENGKPAARGRIDLGGYLAAALPLASESKDEEPVCWWLRAPGHGGNSETIVGADGSPYDFGNYVYSKAGWVRPALWLKI